LEQDLLRRDLTINAMAQAVDEHGQLVGDIIDPYGGQDDLRQKVFRHVSEAFEEDPLRLLRLARFAARFDGFHVHQETLKLLRKIVANQELDALVVERVWQELAKLLMGQTPSNGLKILRDCGVLKYFFGLDEQASNINDALNLIDASASAQHVLAQRVAAIFIGMPHHASSWALRWKVPNECKEYATHIGHVLDLTMLIQSPPIVANNILDLIDRVDFWRKPDRFHQLIAVVALTQVPTNKLDKLTLELKALDLSTALQGGLSGAQIKEQIDRIRLEKIQQFFAS
jgi:tRNA nucleotidyltransferase (CCA-adding enzyme)